MLYTPLIFYIFISFSMPDSLIKAYLHEAQTLHAVVVLRGVSPNTSLKEFLIDKLRPLLKDNSGAVDIRIDPLLFERFQIKKVPTFVQETRHKKRSAYIKLSGSVTAHWAMKKFSSTRAM